MKAFCQLCKEYGHWSAQCPRIKATSHGAAHGKTQGAGFASAASKATAATSPPCRDCTKLRAEIALLKAEIAAHAAELQVLPTVAVASTPVVPTSSHTTNSDINVMSTSSKEKECPECQKRRAKRAQSQKQWRRKTKPTAKPRQPQL